MQCMVPVRLNKDQIAAHLSECRICDHMDEEYQDYSTSTFEQSWWQTIIMNKGYPPVKLRAAGFTVCSNFDG